MAWRRFRSYSFFRRGLIFTGIAAFVALVIGVFVGWLAAVAAFLAALMIPMLMLGPNELDIDVAIGRAAGREVFGSDANERKP